MRLEVQYELEELKRRLQEGEMYVDKANNFVIDDEYEFDYSHREIAEIQDEFMEEAERYLKENYKGQYVIFNNIWCVSIVSVDFYKDKEIKNVIITMMNKLIFDDNSSGIVGIICIIVDKLNEIIGKINEQETRQLQLEVKNQYKKNG